MSAVVAPFGLAAKVLLSPFLTAPLLLLLTRTPEARDYFVNAVHQSKLQGDPLTYLETTIKVLKVIVALGAFSTLKRFLDHVSQNGLKKKGAPWDFTNNKEIILITGGSSGFGLLMAQGFAGKAKIVVWDISPLPDKLKNIPNLHYFKCDMTKPDQIAKTAAATKAEVGNPSVLINNAGIAKNVNILDATPEWTEAIFRVNLISHWQTVREFLPAMLKAKKGHIVEIASASSFLGIGGMADYCATKVGTLAFWEGLNQELRHLYPNGDCIQTSVVHPTWARTNIIAEYEGDLKKAGQIVLDPTLVSKAVVRQVLTGRSGQLIIPDFISFISTLRAWPTFAQEAVRNFMGKKMKLRG